MPRKHRSSSRSSSRSRKSSSKKSSKSKYKSKSSRRRSRSSSTSRSRSTSSDHSRRKKSRNQNRLSRSSSSSTSSSSSSRDRKSSKHKSSTRKDRSESPGYHKKTFDDYESRLPDRSNKTYEFNEGIDELYKNENARRQEITKLKSDHDTGGGFVPKQFKSSRSTQQIKSKKESTDSINEKAIFSNEPIVALANLPKKTDSSDKLVNKNDSVRTLMHENLFEDPAVREKRWKLKMMEVISKIN